MKKEWKKWKPRESRQLERPSFWFLRVRGAKLLYLGLIYGQSKQKHVCGLLNSLEQGINWDIIEKYYSIISVTQNQKRRLRKSWLEDLEFDKGKFFSTFKLTRAKFSLSLFVYLFIFENNWNALPLLFFLRAIISSQILT